MSTLPNFDALQRISAAHHFLTTHMELPAFASFAIVRMPERFGGDLTAVGLELSDRAAVGVYVKAMGLPEPTLEHSHSDYWNYGSQNAVWRVYCTEREPVAPLGEETPEMAT